MYFQHVESTPFSLVQQVEASDWRRYGGNFGMMWIWIQETKEIFKLPYMTITNVYGELMDIYMFTIREERQSQVKSAEHSFLWVWKFVLVLFCVTCLCLAI